MKTPLEIVNEQAEDEGLWFTAQTAPEAYLQQELRRLHEAVEGKSQVECALDEDSQPMTTDWQGRYLVAVDKCHTLLGAMEDAATQISLGDTGFAFEILLTRLKAEGYQGEIEAPGEDPTA